MFLLFFILISVDDGLCIMVGNLKINSKSWSDCNECSRNKNKWMVLFLSNIYDDYLEINVIIFSFTSLEYLLAALNSLDNNNNNANHDNIKECQSAGVTNTSWAWTFSHRQYYYDYYC